MKVLILNGSPKENGNTAIMYLIIGLIGFSIINHCLAQSELNRRATA